MKKVFFSLLLKKKKIKWKGWCARNGVTAERERETDRQTPRAPQNLEFTPAPQAEFLFPKLLSHLFHPWPVRGRRGGWVTKRLRAKA